MTSNKTRMILSALTLFFILTSLNFILAENPRFNVNTNLTLNFASNDYILTNYPEAIIKYDSNSKDLMITDLNSNPIQLSSEKCLDNRCLRKIRTYVVQGNNNNSLALTINYLKLNSEVSASITNLKYNNNNPNEVKFKSGSNLIKIKFPWKNREFSENLVIGKTKLNINYNAKKDYTKVQINSPGKKINVTQPSGVVVADLRTNSGSLEYSLY